MRIFVACQQSAQTYAIPAYHFWGVYFRAGLAEAGHVMVEDEGLDWARGLLDLDPQERAGWKDRTWSRTLATLKREHEREGIDLFLSYLFPNQVEPAALLEIRRLGIPCVNFFCDNVREFRRVPEEYRDFDLHWVPEHKAVALYQQARLPWLLAPMACWVPPLQRRPVEAETLPVTFVGTRDEQREVLFAEAIQRGLECNLCGPGWNAPIVIERGTRPSSGLLGRVRNQWSFARQHGWPALARKCANQLAPRPPLAFDFSPYAKPAQFGDAYWPLLRDCTVCLGVNRYPTLRFPFHRPDTYSRLRDIEAPMAGACYLTEWTEGIDRLYELGTEIETYRDAEELADKARTLLADPSRRRRMRAAAQKRALATHTIGHTLTRIADKLGLRARQ